MKWNGSCKPRTRTGFSDARQQVVQCGAKPGPRPCGAKSAVAPASDGTACLRRSARAREPERLGQSRALRHHCRRGAASSLLGRQARRHAIHRSHYRHSITRTHGRRSGLRMPVAECIACGARRRRASSRLPLTHLIGVVSAPALGRWSLRRPRTHTHTHTHASHQPRRG